MTNQITTQRALELARSSSGWPTRELVMTGELSEEEQSLLLAHPDLHPLLARNPSLSEKSQLFLAETYGLEADSNVLAHLAYNSAVTWRIQEVLVETGLIAAEFLVAGCVPLSPKTQLCILERHPLLARYLVQRDTLTPEAALKIAHGFPELHGPLVGNRVVELSDQFPASLLASCAPHLLSEMVKDAPGALDLASNWDRSVQDLIEATSLTLR